METYWMVDGKKIPDAEYQEIKRRQEMARKQAQGQASALLKRLTDSYTALTEFMEQNPGIVQPVQSDAEHMQQAIYQKLRQNLEQADAAPRCCWIKEDGTPCGSPKLRTDDCCFAHKRMIERQPKKLRFSPVEDANGIQMAIMEVQRALIDDEISEKKAGLLLYSLQIASTNLEKTTFGQKPGEMVTDFVYAEEETATTETQRTGEEQISPLICTDDTDLGEMLPQSESFTAETRRRGENQSSLLIHTDDADLERAGKMLPRGELSTELLLGQAAAGA